MRVLFDVGHPAHVHYFRNLAKHLQDMGDSILFSARPKEMTVDLLKHYGLNYTIIGRVRRGTIGKVIGLINCTCNLFKASLCFKPDILVNASVSAAIVARIIRKPHISLEDTFNMEQVRLYLPFTNAVLTGDYEHRSLGKKEIRYPGYQELAYLHPNVFQPSFSVLESMGLVKGEKYAIIRFVAWNATHDIGQQGVSNSEKFNLIKHLTTQMKVFVSSESELPDELKTYQIRIRPEQMHDALYYAHLFVGEGATMASEAALLGTPAVYIHSNCLGYIKDQVKYGLAFYFPNTDAGVKAALKKISELVSEENIKARFAQLRSKMLVEKIDVTSFLLWFVKEYPNSASIMRNDTSIVNRFR